MPQPFQVGPAAGSEKVPGLFAHMAFGEAAISMGSLNDLPVTYSAIARRCVCEKRTAIEIMGPVSMAAKTPAGLICLKASRLGARSRPPSWQDAQPCLYQPSPFCACRKLAAQKSSPAALATPRLISFLLLACLEMLLDALPVGVIAALHQICFERELRQPDLQLGLEHEGHGVAEKLRFRLRGNAALERFRVGTVSAHAVV